VYCPSCGAQNPDEAAFCAGCGKALPKQAGVQQTSPLPPVAPAGEPAPSMLYYMIAAVATTLLCCPPVGIAAIIAAFFINSKATTGDLAGARNVAKISMILSIVGAALGLIGWLVFLVFLGGFAMLGSAAQNPYVM
jgi:hypothetical protein